MKSGYDMKQWSVNGGADELASRGLAKNAPPVHIVQNVCARAAHAMLWQSTMLDILELRTSSKPLPHRSAGFSQYELNMLREMCN